MTLDAARMRSVQGGGVPFALAAVILRSEEKILPARLTALSEALRPFGERSSIWSDASVGLIARASGVFAPEDAFDRQPVRIGDGTRLVFQGHLCHRSELVEKLGLEPQAAANLADSALFGHAWAHWDDDTVRHVDGCFSSVVWNPGRRTLTAVCSPLAAPPLYFSVTRDRAIIATVPRAIFAWGDVARSLNDTRLAGALILNYGNPRCTYYRNVSSLCPGEMLTVTPHADRIHRFYTLAERVEPVQGRAADFVQTADVLLRRAVAEALRATETPAILLSGGLDSPTVAVTALARRAEDPRAWPLISFTAVPEAGWDGRVPGSHLTGDESGPVRALARRYPALDTRFVDAAGLGVDHLQESVIALAEVPPRNVLNLPWVHECLRLARTSGRGTVLTGEAGNLTLSYAGATLSTLLRGRRWWAGLREAAAAPERLYRAVRQRIRGDRGWHWPQYSAIHPDYARDLRVEEQERRSIAGPYAKPAESSLEARIRAISNPIRQGDGRAITNAVQAIHGVVLRSPLLDRRLAEWCLGVPEEHYQHLGRRRLLIRRLMQNRLPAEIMQGLVGRQAADWHLRTSRALPRIRETLEDWRGDPAVAGRIDLPRLLRVVDTWPSRTPLSRRDHPEYEIVALGLERALAVGRFIRWVHRGYEETP